MVELMLRHPMQHVAEVIFLSRNPLAQPSVGQNRDRLYQHIMRALHLSDGPAPRRIGGFRNDGKISNPCRLDFLSAQPAAGCGVPRSDMQDKFPDAMSVSQRLRRSRGSIYIVQQFKQSWAMPGIAFESAAQLISDKRGFGN